jgi:hypothetical protein
MRNTDACAAQAVVRADAPQAARRSTLSVRPQWSGARQRPRARHQGPGVIAFAVRSVRDTEFGSRKISNAFIEGKNSIMRTSVLYSVQFPLLCAIRVYAADAAPSTVFDLEQWKLQIPGPKEIKDLKDYSSEYFHLNAAKKMCFHLDAAEKGTTAHTHYVRSELRHLPNWEVNDTHTISAEVRVISRLKPDKVTVLQIHGMAEHGANAPPLLRIAVNNGDLVAVIKTTNDGDKNETVVLTKGLGSSSVKVEVSVKSKQLKITVNDQVRVNRSLSFWKFLNYWKAGCYPQAAIGTVDVMFRKLTAN